MDDRDVEEECGMVFDDGATLAKEGLQIDGDSVDSAQEDATDLSSTWLQRKSRA
jgi:hypothetical protein